MMAKTNIITKVLHITIFFLIFSTISAASTTQIDIVYFGTETCFDCVKEMKYINSVVNDLKPQGVYVNYIFMDTLKDENKEALHNYDTAYKVPDSLLNVGGKAFVGDEFFTGNEIEENLKTKILYYHDNPQEYNPPIITKISETTALEKANNLLNTFTPLAVFVAGLLDGFNPCAIAMLLFFITFLAMSGRKNKEILYTGFLYIVGTFLSYLGIGFGLFRFTFIFREVKTIMIIIFSLTLIMSIILMLTNIRDYYKIKTNKYNEVKTQLPKTLKHKIHNFIRSHNSAKMIYISAFLSGFVVSFLEFFCTGQIYLPTISYLLSTQNAVGISWAYLILYNFAFTLPLIIVCFAIYKGKEIIDISQMLVNKLHIVKLIGAIFFALIIIIMTIQIASII